MKPTALVLAGSSFLGRHLCACLRARGVPAVATARRPEPGTWPCDVTHEADVRQIFAECRPRWVFQCAAATTPNAPPAQLYGVHVGGTLNVLKTAAELAPEATIVLFGSAAEYGSVPGEALPVSESQREAPTSFFGASKLAQTRLGLAAAAEWGLRIIVARPFNLIGPGLPDHYLAAALARRLRDEGDREEPFAVANGCASRDFVDVRDVAEAVVLFAEREVARPGKGCVFNLASGQETTVLEVAEHLCRLAGRRRAVDLGAEPSRSGVSRSCGDARRARAVGWVPRIGWKQSLEDLWREWSAAPAEPFSPRVKQPLP